MNTEQQNQTIEPVTVKEAIEEVKVRNPDEVLEKVLSLVPEQEKSVRARIMELQYDNSYIPPEHNHIKWVHMATVLNTELPFPPKEDWQKEIYRVVVMKEPPV